MFHKTIWSIMVHVVHNSWTDGPLENRKISMEPSWGGLSYDDNKFQVNILVLEKNVNTIRAPSLVRFKTAWSFLGSYNLYRIVLMRGTFWQHRYHHDHHHHHNNDYQDNEDHHDHHQAGVHCTAVAWWETNEQRTTIRTRCCSSIVIIIMISMMEMILIMSKIG